MITENQAQRLAEAGLYAYNHNLDTSEEYYKSILTRGFEDRIQTIENVKNKCNSMWYYRNGESIEQSWYACRAFYIKSSTKSVPINVSCC
jgi:ubiquinone biosynthesis protein COQ9